MITTRRNDTYSINALASETSNGGVALLERKDQTSYKEPALDAVGETAEEAKKRMQENLEKLLNFDRYSEVVQDAKPVAPISQAVNTVEAQAIVAEPVQEVPAVTEADIRPTSTTMQFGESNIEEIRMDMQREVEEESTGKYKLNAKGKVVVILYALVLTVVMALIAINTGVLANLDASLQSASAKYDEKVQVLNAIDNEYKNLSTPEHVIEQAIELGMIK